MTDIRIVGENEHRLPGSRSTKDTRATIELPFSRSWRLAYVLSIAAGVYASGWGWPR